MKKISLAVVTLLVVMSIASCTKKYTCTETSTSNGHTTTTIYNYDKLQRSQASEMERKGTYTITMDGETYVNKIECD